MVLWGAYQFVLASEWGLSSGRHLLESMGSYSRKEGVWYRPALCTFNTIFNTVFFLLSLNIHVHPTKPSRQLEKCKMGSQCYTKLVNRQKSKQKATLAFLFPYNSSKVQYMYVHFQL